MGIEISEAFRDIRLWVFDLDNTLYPADCNLFAQVDKRMSEYIQRLLGLDHAEARRIQKQLYYDHGTTLSGLMIEHGITPGDFLDYVHDIDLEPILPAPDLGGAIGQLPGRKFIFTNGSVPHAERVAGKLGVLHHFDGIFDIVAGDYIPKPKPEAFAKFVDFCGGLDCKGAMFEDLPHNLEAAHAIGLATVLVHSSYRDHPSQQAFDNVAELPGYIDFYTDNLTAFLSDIAPPQQ